MLVYLDTRAVGRGSSARLIELAVIDEAGQVLIDEMFGPGVPVTETVSKDSGISDAMLAGKPTIEERSPALREILKDVTTWVSYRANHDAEHVRDLMPEDAKRICVMLDYAKRRKVKPVGLEAAAEFVEHRGAGDQRRALSAAYACRSVHRWMNDLPIDDAGCSAGATAVAEEPESAPPPADQATDDQGPDDWDHDDPSPDDGKSDSNEHDNGKSDDVSSAPADEPAPPVAPPSGEGEGCDKVASGTTAMGTKWPWPGTTAPASDGSSDTSQGAASDADSKDAASATPSGGAEAPSNGAGADQEADGGAADEKSGTEGDAQDGAGGGVSAGKGGATGVAVPPKARPDTPLFPLLLGAAAVALLLAGVSRVAEGVRLPSLFEEVDRPGGVVALPPMQIPEPSAAQIVDGSSAAGVGEVSGTSRPDGGPPHRSKPASCDPNLPHGRWIAVIPGDKALANFRANEIVPTEHGAAIDTACGSFRVASATNADPAPSATVGMVSSERIVVAKGVRGTLCVSVTETTGQKRSRLVMTTGYAFVDDRGTTVGGVFQGTCPPMR